LTKFSSVKASFSGLRTIQLQYIEDSEPVNYSVKLELDCVGIRYTFSLRM